MPAWVWRDVRFIFLIFFLPPLCHSPLVALSRTLPLSLRVSKVGKYSRVSLHAYACIDLDSLQMAR